MSSVSPLPPIHTLRFQLQRIALYLYQDNWINQFDASEYASILIFANGSGSIEYNNQLAEWFAGSCVYLPVGAVPLIHNKTEHETKFYRLEFQMFDLQATPPYKYEGELFHNRLLLNHCPSCRFYQLAATLEECGDHNSPVAQTKRQLRFHELIVLLLETMDEDQIISDPKYAVENSIALMKNHFMKPLTVKQLAASSQLPIWKYRTYFKELTGLKPLEYLTELRIEQAKLSLARTDLPLRKVAENNGFTDEYYFNRRFRQITGMTPRQYSSSIRCTTLVTDWTGHEVNIPAQPRSIFCHKEVCGDLHVLGVSSVGALDDWMRGVHTSSTMLSGKMNDATERPDLIIMADPDEDQYERVSSLAPTVTYNSFASLENRLGTLGDLLGKQMEAAAWLEAYKERTHAVWSQLRSDLKQGETASVFIYEHGRRLFAMGTSGFAPVLYHQNGFQPTAPIRKLLNEETGYIQICERTLHRYAGDRIFMLLSDNPVSRAAAKHLMESPLWLSFPAVRNGHVYTLDASSWNEGDARSRSKALESLPKLLHHIS